MSLATTLSEKLRLDHLLASEQAAIIADLESIIMANVTTAVLEALPPASREQFEELVASASDEEILLFIKKHLTNFEEIKEKEATTVIADFLSHFED